LSSVDQKVALVTASGGMMGAAIARLLAERGYRLVVNDRNEERTKAIGDEVKASGAEVIAVQADVTLRDDVDMLIGAAVDQWGCIDVLVNVAGGIKGPIMNPIWEITDEQWSVTLATNLTSAFLTVSAALPSMMARRRGSIVNIASTSWAGSPAHSHYAAAKAGLVSFTRSIATQLGPYGVRANVVAPGGTKTRAALRSDGGQLSDDSEHVSSIPLGRLNEPEDVANAVAFLASEEARNISGQVLTVAGGVNPAI
jgi:NAD(P)-dependent dehydrogenase (short-subunit alcohol dehydrogenase family)